MMVKRNVQASIGSQVNTPAGLHVVKAHVLKIQAWCGSCTLSSTDFPIGTGGHNVVTRCNVQVCPAASTIA